MRRHLQKSIDVILADPEEGVVDQEAADFGAVVIEDQRSPVGMSPQSAILVFKEHCSIKAGQTLRVAWEVSGNPIEDNPVIVVLAGVDEILELIGSILSACRRKAAQDLVSQGLIEWMLENRYQLDVRVAQVFDIRDKRVG